jgi:hypothetical protein
MRLITSVNTEQLQTISTGVADTDNLDSTGAADGYVLTADGIGGTAWEAVPAPAISDVEGTDILSTGVTDGYVLTADGVGGTAWEAAVGGGVWDLISELSWSSDVTGAEIDLDWSTYFMFKLSGEIQHPNNQSETRMLTSFNNGTSYAVAHLNGLFNGSTTGGTISFNTTNYNGRLFAESHHLSVIPIDATISGGPLVNGVSRTTYMVTKYITSIPSTSGFVGGISFNAISSASDSYPTNLFIKAGTGNLAKGHLVLYGLKR